MRPRTLIAGGGALAGLVAILLFATADTGHAQQKSQWGRPDVESYGDASGCCNTDGCCNATRQARQGSEKAKPSGKNRARRGGRGKGPAQNSSVNCGWGACGGASCGSSVGGSGNGKPGCGGGACSAKDIGEMIEDPAKTPLTQVERADLFFMLQEEQLARDVYTQLLETWSFRPYANISRSEQTHMDLLHELADTYEVKGAPKTRVGEFRNPAIQTLHDQLVAQGWQSLDQAIVVGARIEELDIVDLRERQARTTNPDLKRVYTILETGSRNHLRAFARHLQRRDIDFTPEHLSEQEFWEIAAGEHERCFAEGD